VRPVPPPPDRGPPQDPLASKLEPIFAGLTKDHAPGCAVGVFRAGEILFAKGYGVASLENDVPITPRTTFEIGSMSKQFTATAILLLAQDGKLSLDDDVRKHLPELPDYGHPITLRHLLHHTGGFREYDDLLTLSGWDVVDVATEAEALHLVALQKGTNFRAGSEFSYSNTGYFLLAQVVRRVSGKSLAVFSKERIFEPLGMKDTSIFDDHALVVARHATGYSARDGGFQVNMSAREMTGEGNVQSTIEDLARWDKNFYEPKVGGASWLATMRTPGKLDDGTPLTYAMGLQVRTEHGLQEETHAGGWAGYLSDGRRYPTERLSVTCLCNWDGSDPIALTRAVARALLPALATPAGGSPAQADTKTSPPPAGPDVGLFAGSYLDPGGLLVRTFVAKDGALQLTFPPGPGAPPPIALERLDARSFRVPGATSKWTFEPAAGKTPPRVVRTAPDEKPKAFERFAAQTLDAAKLAAYVGRYESPEMTHDYEVALVDGALVAGPWGKRHMAAKLTPLAPDAFRGEYGHVFGREGGAGGKVVDMVIVFNGHRAVRWKKK
jgi:CubicO group peptidase (beta-lactamase class C family)